VQYQTKGPCIRVGDTLAMPVVDAFSVVENVQGDLKATTIHVRVPSPHGPLYPKQLTEGRTYALRLTPSATTQQQLRGNASEGLSFIWIDGDEIEEQRPGK
jgi:hypothetical protein